MGPETRTYGSSTSLDPGFVCDDDTMSGEMAIGFPLKAIFS